MTWKAAGNDGIHTKIFEVHHWVHFISWAANHFKCCYYCLSRYNVYCLTCDNNIRLYYIILLCYVVWPIVRQSVVLLIESFAFRTDRRGRMINRAVATSSRVWSSSWSCTRDAGWLITRTAWRVQCHCRPSSWARVCFIPIDNNKEMVRTRRV